MNFLKIPPFLLVLSVCSHVSSVYSQIPEGLPQQIKNMTGSDHVRMVYHRDDHQNMDARVLGGEVWGYDSKTNEIHRIALSHGKTGLKFPNPCRGGHKVVVTSAGAGGEQILVANFADEDLAPGDQRWKYICDGLLQDVFVNGGKEYAVHYSNGYWHRTEIENPSNTVSLFAGGNVDCGIQVSRDGTTGCGQFPWPNCEYMVNPAKVGGNDVSRQVVGDGCWTSIQNVDGGTYWCHLLWDGVHRRMNVFNGTTLLTNQLHFNEGNVVDLSAGGVSDEFYTPRFAHNDNTGRILLFVGGFPGANVPGNSVEVFMRKFSAGYTGWEGGCVRLTYDDVQAAMPEMYLDVTPLGPGVRLSTRSAGIAIDETLDLTAEVTNPEGGESITWSVAGGTLSSQAGTSVTFTPSGAGDATVTASIGEGRSATCNVKVIDWSTYHVRVNCGGGSVPDWEDAGSYIDSYNGANNFVFDANPDVSGIDDAAPSAVYNTVYHTDGGSHTFSFDVPDGHHGVRMHFYDIADGRTMEFLVEGSSVLSSYDPLNGVATVKEFTVEVSDGNGLQVECKSHGDDVFLAGIEVFARAASRSGPSGGQGVAGRGFCIRRIAGGQYRITVSSGAGEFRTEIVSVSGAVVHSASGRGETQVAQNALGASGVYFVRVVSGNVRFVQKIVIRK